MDAFLIQVISSLQNSFDFWGLSLCMFVISFSGVLITRRYFGYAGLIAFNCVALVIANILVLKLADMSFVGERVALGTIIFSATLLVSDLIVEDYGLKKAKQGIWITFYLQLFVLIFMVIGLSYPLLEGSDVLVQTSNDNHNAMARLFVPSLRLFVASMISFLAGQFINVYVFDYISRNLAKRYEKLRYYISMFLSEIADIFLFSAIAFKFLNPVDLSWGTVFWTYMFTTFILRTLIVFLNASAIKVFGRFSVPAVNT